PPTRKKKARLRKGGDGGEPRDRGDRSDKKAEVAIDALLPGDEIELQPGDDLPVDGTIVSGGGFIDESLMVGKSLPAARKPGDFVLAGTTPTIPDLIVRVAAESNASLLVQREQLAAGVAEELSQAGTTGKLAALAVTLLVL